RVRGKGLRQGAGLLLLQSFDLLEERDKGLRIVSRLVHVLHAQEICFALKVARELHESQRYTDTQGSLRPFVHGPASRHEDQRNSRQVGDITPGLLASHMTCRDVTDLMRHHTG